MTEPPTSRADPRSGAPAFLRLPAVYVDLARFLRAPRLPEARVTGLKAWRDVVWLWLLNLAIALPLAVGLGALKERAEVTTPNFNMLIDRGPAFTLLMGALIIPFLEELIFRGWLNGRRRNLVLLQIAIIAAVAIGWQLATPGGALGAGAVLLVALLAGAFVLWRERGDFQVPQWFVRLFPAIFALQAIAFALLHLTNYQERGWVVLVFVVPQLIAGLILGFARVRIGLWASVAVHALSNGLLFSLVLLKV